MDGVDDNSVRVSWQTVDDADRYTVIFRKTTGNSQQGLCFDSRRVRISLNVSSTTVSIGVGQMLAHSDTPMLRAYTTYSIIVVAKSDVTDSSEKSEPITVTTNQTSN